MSAGLHKILRRGEEGAKVCSASWAMLWPNYWLFLSLLHICCKRGRLVWMFESEHCRATYQNRLHLVPAWTWNDTFRSSQKRHRGLEKQNTCLLPVLSQLRYLPFSATPVSFFSFFFFFFSLCIFWPLPYWEGRCQLAGRMHRLSRRWAFLHKQTHEYVNVYRSRRWTVPPFIHTDSGGLMRHPLVALWSSSVKVYALSHVGKDPPGLFLLSSMILFAGCWCLSSVL